MFSGLRAHHAIIVQCSLRCHFSQVKWRNAFFGADEPHEKMSRVAPHVPKKKVFGGLCKICPEISRRSPAAMGVETLKGLLFRVAHQPERT